MNKVRLWLKLRLFTLLYPCYVWTSKRCDKQTENRPQDFKGKLHFVSNKKGVYGILREYQKCLFMDAERSHNLLTSEKLFKPRKSKRDQWLMALAESMSMTSDPETLETYDLLVSSVIFPFRRICRDVTRMSLSRAEKSSVKRKTIICKIWIAEFLKEIKIWPLWLKKRFHHK